MKTYMKSPEKQQNPEESSTLQSIQGRWDFEDKKYLSHLTLWEVK